MYRFIKLWNIDLSMLWTYYIWFSWIWLSAFKPEWVLVLDHILKANINLMTNASISSFTFRNGTSACSLCKFILKLLILKFIISITLVSLKSKLIATFLRYVNCLLKNLTVLNVDSITHSLICLNSRITKETSLMKSALNP